MKDVLVLALSLGVSLATAPTGNAEHFERLVLSEEFHSEGAAVADIDNDSINDVVSGPYWYRGPDYRSRFAYAEVKDYAIKNYSDHFFTFAQDFDGDGDIDLFSVPIPGREGVWYENPGASVVRGPWKRHLALSSVDNESPTFADITGDGVGELVCLHQGRYGYASPPPNDPTLQWKFVPITPNNGYGRFTHGLGVGDIDGDGRADLIEKDGWWRQPETANELFEFRPQKFAQSGGAQMFAYDFDGDGDRDVLSVQNAHAYGLSWFERRGDGDDFLFVEHPILKTAPDEDANIPSISQMHAVALEDVDGDGIKDVVTGKRFWAHGGKDPGATRLPVLYWFRTLRTSFGVDFEPHRIDARVGVGTQLTCTDIDHNGRTDIVVGNKLGTFVLLGRDDKDRVVRHRPAALSDDVVNRIGGDEFKKAIRTTDPLEPEEERATFVVPAGFDVQLVAAEPEIAKPLNMAFDARGRMWVSSSVEYPYPAKEGEGRDTIKILEDTDGDGRADKVTTFADNLNIPIGLYPYRDGVVCYSIPNIWYLSDTDGDDVCDKREILYGPFDYSRDTHGMCNGFTRGFDGWLYACHGFNNRSNVAGKDGHQVSMNSGNTFRIRLDGSRIEHFTDGQVNPFGMAIDPDGDLLTADCHTKPVTLLMRGGVYQGFGKPHDGLGFVPDVMEHLHGSTAIGGIALYHADVFPQVYHGNSFGGNVMTSRINRNSLQRNGSSVRAREESDFLISGDPWFRPVDLQIGPDGAMYVADFYNRIIGHYEVGLDHPGRDRHRGRIWRIAFSGDPGRRDISPLDENPPAAPSVRNANLDADTDVRKTISDLASANLARRMLAADHLVDRIGNAAIEPVRSAIAESDDADALSQLLWVLFRLDALTDVEIRNATQSPHPRVRRHAYQIIGARPDPSDAITDLLPDGLKDADPLVRRAAAMAAGPSPSPGLTESLLRALQDTNPADVHLIHAIRMSLRDHLSDAAHFASVTSSLDESELKAVVDVCLGIKTDFSGDFVTDNLPRMGKHDSGKLTEYLTFAAQFATEDRLPQIAAIAQKEYAEDVAYQEQLLRSVQDGLRRRGIGLPQVIQSWATELVRHHLGLQDGQQTLPMSNRTIGWNYIPHPASSKNPNPWTLSTKRNSADGERASRLHSSFPNGETLTGIYRSERFRLPETFEFFIAGHDGYPDKALQNLNYVCVRDAATLTELKRWSPPRNDTAHPTRWSPGEHQGKEVVVELVDGDTAGAYAWLAVGRFSVDGLNPNRHFEKRRRAASLIADFKLQSLRGVLKQMIDDPGANRESLAAYCRAWTAITTPSPTFWAITDSVEMTGVDQALRRELISALLGTSDASPADLLGRVAERSTRSEQQRLADRLASDRQGASLLLALVEAGQVSAGLLKVPAVQNKLQSVISEADADRVVELTKDLPEESQMLVQAMTDQRSAYLAAPGDRSLGGQLFAKHCGVCHQVAGKGTAVGPNLDGIGNRGLDRLVEDVMSPNRNIDAAFRASVILTEDGQVYSGLVKPSDGSQIVIIDQTGKENRIDEEEIADRKTVQSSPMPANFHETLDADQMRDLLSYLLSLTH